MRGWRENTESPRPPGLGTLKSQILSCSYTNPSETEVQRRLCVDISIHYPVPEAGNPGPDGSHTLARPHGGGLSSFSPAFTPTAASQAWTSSVYPYLSLTGTKRTQKRCLTSWCSSEAGDYYQPFFFFFFGNSEDFEKTDSTFLSHGKVPEFQCCQSNCVDMRKHRNG